MAINRKSHRTLKWSLIPIFEITASRNERKEVQAKIVNAYRERHPGSSGISPVFINDSIAAPINAIVNLNLNPGEPYFMFWYAVSVYFPLIAACLGPLANMISLIALIEHWRVDINTENIISDTPAVSILNSVSLALGIMGNLSFTMNFTRILLYTVTQITSICCWIMASALQLAAIIITRFEFKRHSNLYSPSDGFWFGVFTCFFYLCCACLLSLNFLGYTLKKYPDYFNLTPDERKLMAYTLVFAIWAIIGTVVMRKLISGLTYGSSLYFCVVSFLTIGLGDILPITSGAKVMVLILSLGGVLIMGLIVSKIRQVVASSSGPTIFWHQIEIKRSGLIQQMKSENIKLTPRQSFAKMRQIKHEAKQKQLNISLLITLTIFLLFWLIGGVVFHFIEDWSYFNSIYFCFLCLITIGYGDFAPVTPLGRVFFISWGISAVPLMTILISNIGDKIFYSGSFLKLIFERVCFIGYFKKVIFGKSKENPDRKLSESTLSSSSSRYRSFEDNERVASNTEDGMSANSEREEMMEWEAKHLIGQQEQLETLLKEFEGLKSILLDSIENPEKLYDIDAWSKSLDKPDSNHSKSKFYWLEKNSPLTLPLREPSYFLSRTLQGIEQHIKDLIASEETNIDELISEDDKPEGEYI